MPTVKCSNCGQPIKFASVPANGSIQCKACGSTFRVQSKTSANRPAKPTPPATSPSTQGKAERPTPPPESKSPSEVSTPKKKSTKKNAPDFSFLTGAEPSPPEVANGFPEIPEVKEKSSLLSVEQVESPPVIPTPMEKQEQEASDTASLAGSVPSLDASPYTPPVPMQTHATRVASSNSMIDLVATPAPGFMAGIFDLSFRHSLTPQIVKLLWLLAVICAVIGWVLAIGSFLLSGYGIVMVQSISDNETRVAMHDSRAAPTPLIGFEDRETLVQFTPDFESSGELEGFEQMMQPSSSGGSMGGGSMGGGVNGGGKVLLFLFTAFYTAVICVAIFMWLLLYRLLLEGFCVLHAIRANVATADGSPNL